MAKDKKNTGGRPAEMFYYKDFLADMQEHPTEIVGAWILLLIKIWHSKSNGSVTRDIFQLSRIMNTTVEEAERYIGYIDSEGIADVSRANGDITVACRRCQRDSKLMEQNRLRQTKYRDRRVGNEKETAEKRENNGDVTDDKRNPSVSIPIPISLIGIGVEERTLEEGELELEKEVQSKALWFTDELDKKFCLKGHEPTTFARVVQQFCEWIRQGRYDCRIFEDVLEWADEALATGEKPKAMFMARIKLETGYTGKGMTLNRD